MAGKRREIIMVSLRFLTNEEVEVLTGYKQKKRQAEWLACQGISFKVNAIGRVVVLADRLDFRRPSDLKLNPAWVKSQQSRAPQACS